MPKEDRLDKLTRLLERDPSNSFALYGIAMEYRSRGELERAAQTFEDLLTRFPEVRAAFLQQGLTLAALGEFGRARKVYEQGIRICEESGDEHAAAELREALEQLDG